MQLHEAVHIQSCNMQRTSVLHFNTIVMVFGSMGRNMMIVAKELLDREHMAHMSYTALAF